MVPAPRRLRRENGGNPGAELAVSRDGAAHASLGHRVYQKNKNKKRDKHTNKRACSEKAGPVSDLMSTRRAGNKRPRGNAELLAR